MRTHRMSYLRELLLLCNYYTVAYWKSLRTRYWKTAYNSYYIYYVPLSLSLSLVRESRRTLLTENSERIPTESRELFRRVRGISYANVTTNNCTYVGSTGLAGEAQKYWRSIDLQRRIQLVRTHDACLHFEIYFDAREKNVCSLLLAVRDKNGVRASIISLFFSGIYTCIAYARRQDITRVSLFKVSSLLSEAEMEQSTITLAHIPFGEYSACIRLRNARDCVLGLSHLNSLTKAYRAANEFRIDVGR